MHTSINIPSWLIRCADIAEKQYLFDYATERGVPVAAQPLNYGATPYRDDKDLDVRWLKVNQGEGLFSLPSNRTIEPSLTAADFCRLCDEYATMQAIPKHLLLPHAQTQTD